MIEIKGVCAGYGKTEVLHDVDLNIKKGEIMCIVGRNGCGKSTLLKALVKINPLSGGKILIDGKSQSKYTQNELAQKIAYLPQSRSIADMTVIQTVLHGRFPYLSYPRKYSRDDMKIMRQALYDMDIEALADKKLTELSGGQRQKVYIAMALAQKSPVILMDEPMTYLDIVHSLKLCEMIKKLSGMGKTVVIVMHDLSLAMKIADRICVMKSGEVFACGTPDDIMASGALKTAFDINVESVSKHGGTHYYYELEKRS